MTPRQRAMLDYITDRSRNGAPPPSFDEIIAHTDITSKSICKYNLDKLEDMGYIEREAGKARSIRLVKRDQLTWYKGSFDNFYANIPFGLAYEIIKGHHSAFLLLDNGHGHKTHLGEHDDVEAAKAAAESHYKKEMGKFL